MPTKQAGGKAGTAGGIHVAVPGGPKIGGYFAQQESAAVAKQKHEKISNKNVEIHGSQPGLFRTMVNEYHVRQCARDKQAHEEKMEELRHQHKMEEIQAQKALRDSKPGKGNGSNSGSTKVQFDDNWVKHWSCSKKKEMYKHKVTNACQEARPKQYRSGNKCTCGCWQKK